MSSDSDIYIGIDPGLKGAICIMASDGIDLYDAPLLGKQPDARQMFRLCGAVSPPKANVYVAIERIHVMPKTSRVSAVTMGRGAGIWIGVVAARGYSLVEVTAAQWRRVMHVGIGDKGKTARDKSLVAAGRLFPDVVITRRDKPCHDRAEALLIAEWLRRSHGA